MHEDALIRQHCKYLILVSMHKDALASFVLQIFNFSIYALKFI